MKALSVLGLGAVCGAGAGRPALAAALSGAPLPAGRFSVQTPDGPREVPARRADTGPLDAFIPRRTIRRADTYARLALLGACLALEDAGLPLGALWPDTALVLASAHGASGSTLSLVDSMIADGDACSSPTHFVHSLHNSAGAYLTANLGILGPCLTVSQGWLSVPSALLSARSLLACGQAKRVLFGAVEELSDLPALLAQAAAPDQAPGEGAVFLVLEADRSATALRIADLRFGGPDGEAPPRRSTMHLGGLDGVDRFGWGPALPAFQLAAGLLALEGDPSMAAVELRWAPPGEGRASARLERPLAP